LTLKLCLIITHDPDHIAVSIYEISILSQVVEWKRLLNTPLPMDLVNLKVARFLPKESVV
jgi:hypothetical protein